MKWVDTIYVCINLYEFPIYTWGGEKLPTWKFSIKIKWPPDNLRKITVFISVQPFGPQVKDSKQQKTWALGIFPVDFEYIELEKKHVNLLVLYINRVSPTNETQTMVYRACWEGYFAMVHGNSGQRVVRKIYKLWCVYIHSQRALIWLIVCAGTEKFWLKFYWLALQAVLHAFHPYNATRKNSVPSFYFFVSNKVHSIVFLYKKL